MAMTAASNRLELEPALREKAVEGLRFEYVDLPSTVRCMKKYPGGVQFYAYLWQVKAAFVARRLHREDPFDLYHHITYANDWMASHAGALLDIPFVRGPGGGAQAVPEPFLRDRGLSFQLAQGFRSALQHLLRLDPFFLYGQSRASSLLFCTQESIETVPERWRDKTELFPVNGVLEEELKTPSMESVEPFRVLTVGRLVPIKGFDIALRAFARFASQREGVELRIVGEGKEDTRLRELAESLGVRDSTTFTGWRTQPQVLGEMAEADVLLFPSLRDGGGAVVVEAMACGLPVVCLDHAGPGLHVTEETGVKVPPSAPENTVKGMSQALAELHANPELRREMSEAARKRVRERYLWTELGRRLEYIYRDALGENFPSVSGGSRREVKEVST